jgi:hypothetical protein
MWAAIIASSRKRGSFVQSLIKFFKERVLNDSGVIEAESCLETQLDNLIEGASLVITPNGYKESKLYSIIPEDGSGDFAVTRSGVTATRINSDGLVELVPNNFILRSADLQQATWAKQNTTIVSSTYLAPNGSLTAYELVGNNGVNYLYNTANATNIVTNSFTPNNQIHTISFYLKYKGLNRIRLLNGSTTNVNQYNHIEVDLNLGIITDANYGSIAYGGFIEDAGDGWYRVGFITTLNIALSNIRFAIGLGDSVKTVADGVDGVYIWGPQLVLGTEQKSYIPTLTRNNYPRIDYSNGTCPNILIESTRTNLIPSSNVLGALNSVTRTLNYGISPEGIQNSFLIELGGATTNGVNLGVTHDVISTTYTISFWAKAAPDTTSLQIQLSIAPFDGSAAQLTNIITTYEWQRYFVTFTAVGIGSNSRIRNGQAVEGKKIEFYGFQLEVGANATSLIPTVGASIARGAENYLLQGDDVIPLVGQQEGTILIKGRQLNRGILFRLTNTGSITVDRISFFCNGIDGDTNITFSKNNTTNTLSNVGGAVIEKNVIIRYSQSQITIFVNGNLITTYNYPAPLDFSQPLNRVQFGSISESATGTFELIALWGTQLTDTECINLTTL